MKFAQLLDRNLGRSVHHQVLRLLVEWERDHFADVRLVRQQHHHAVHARGNAAVRRRTQLERIDHAAELVVDHAAVIAGDLKRLVHHFRLVVANRAGGELDAVADDVVLVGENIERIFVQQRIHAALRHRKRVVAEHGRTGLLVLLEHREIHDPAELEHIRVDQFELAAQLRDHRSADLLDQLLRVGQEEQRIAGLHSARRLQRGQDFRSQELHNRALFTLFAPDDIGHALRAVFLRELDHVVEELARFARDFRRLDRPDHAAVGDHARKGLEAAIAELLGDVDHLQRVAEVRLIRTEPAHRLAVRNPRERRMGKLLGRKFAEHILKQSLDHREDIVLLHKAHLDVELVEFAGAAVGARILVAEARRNLEIAVEARHHQQLLELLRSLRQRVELARMQAGRHQIVAGAFRAARGQDRSLELVEAVRGHITAHLRDHLAAEHDVPVQFVAAQIEETVFQAHRLGRAVVLRDQKRDHFGVAENLHVGRLDLNLAGRELRIDRAFGTGDHFAVETHHRLHPPAFQRLIEGAFRIDHHLRDAVVVAQVDEDHAAVVADAVNPPGEADGLPNVCLAEFAAGVGTVLVHDISL